MSTRCSIFYVTCAGLTVHIYKEMIDNKIYLEVDNPEERVEILVPLISSPTGQNRDPVKAPDGRWERS